jgi:membrane protease YdiL (CAAX protease family)
MPHGVHARVAAALSTALLFALVAGGLAVLDAERSERDLEAVLDARTPASGAVSVARAELVLVEVCAAPAPAGAVMIPVLVEAPDATAPRAIVAVRTLGEATMGASRRNAEGACWTAFEGMVPRAGSVRARLADVQDAEGVALVARVHVRASSTAWDRAATVLVGLAALALALGLALAPLPVDAPAEHAGSRAMALGALVVGAGLVAAASQGVRHVGGAGAAGGLARGLLLALAELGIALALTAWLARVGAGGSTAAMLGAHRPRGGGLVLAAAPLVGVLCALAATWLLRVVPSSPGEPPITLFVARPSGALAFGVLALSAPLAEELFFRGFVQSAATHALGRAGAVAVSAGLFTLAHAQQAWGAWGGLAAVAWLGVVLALLRASTRSSAATMLAHLAYNVVLTAPFDG